MRLTRHVFVAAMLVGTIDRASAQVVVVSAPNEPSLLTLTRRWSRASTLGDLRERSLGANDIEVRAWGGYGLGSTGAIVLRRVDGAWSALRATVVGCTLAVPIPVGDTASKATLRQWVSDARKQCGVTLGDVSRGSFVVRAETLAVEPLGASSDAIDRAWTSAVAEGLLALPPQVERTWTMLDGFTYVIEVRQGDRYRAAEIQQVEEPEVPADTRIKKVYAALTAVPGFARQRPP